MSEATPQAASPLLQDGGEPFEWPVGSGQWWGCTHGEFYNKPEYWPGMLFEFSDGGRFVMRQAHAETQYAEGFHTALLQCGGAKLYRSRPAPVSIPSEEREGQERELYEAFGRAQHAWGKMPYGRPALKEQEDFEKAKEALDLFLESKRPTPVEPVPQEWTLTGFLSKVCAHHLVIHDGPSNPWPSDFPEHDNDLVITVRRKP